VGIVATRELNHSGIARYCDQRKKVELNADVKGGNSKAKIRTLAKNRKTVYF